MEESHDPLNRRSSEHIFCGFSRKSSQITNFENYYYGMDEGSDQTTYSEEDDECDETNTDDGDGDGDVDGDCESTFHYASKRESCGRLSRRNVATRLDRGSENDNSFRNRSKWKKYNYQAVSRTLPIREEDEDEAGPSTTITDTTMATATSTATSKATAKSTIINKTFPDAICTKSHLATDIEINKHIVIHVNELGFEDDDDELSFDEEICFDSNSVSSV